MDAPAPPVTGVLRRLVALTLFTAGFIAARTAVAHTQDRELGLPLGNGGLGAWVEREAPDSVLIWIEHPDLWDAQGRRLRLGRIRIQCLGDRDPGLELEAADPSLHRGRAHVPLQWGRSTGELIAWIDVEQDRLVGQLRFDEPTSVRLGVDPWRRRERELDAELAAFEDHPSLEGATTAPDRLWARGSLARESVVWFHRNETSTWGSAMSASGLGELRSSREDPLLHRTVGGVLRSKDCRRASPLALESDGDVESLTFEVVCHGSVNPTPKGWVTELEQLVGNGSPSVADRRGHHDAHWESIEARSWIRIQGSPLATSISEAYRYQRHLALASSGPGSSELPAPPVDPDDPDARWGGRPTPWRETRLWAWSLLATGDGDRLHPLFETYARALPLARARTRQRHGHSGLTFPDPMTPWGLGKDPAATSQSWAHNLELLALGVELHAYQRDDGFFASKVLPLAQGILTFYERHFPRDDEGRITIVGQGPNGAHGIVTNSMAEIAGLHRVLGRLIELPDHLVIPQNRARWDWLRGSLPSLPIEDVDGVTRLLPAHSFGERTGSGHPELEAIFPFELFGVGLPDLDLGRASFVNRSDRPEGPTCPDSIQAASLGLTESARAALEQAVSGPWSSAEAPRFRGRDLDAGTRGAQGFVPMITLQRMLLQCRGRELHLLPAWPRDWSVDFQLHGPNNTVVRGRWSEGEWTALDVEPSSRRSDIILHEPR